MKYIEIAFNGSLNGILNFNVSTDCFSFTDAFNDSAFIFQIKTEFSIMS